MQQFRFKRDDTKCQPKPSDDVKDFFIVKTLAHDLLEMLMQVQCPELKLNVIKFASLNLSEVLGGVCISSIDMRFNSVQWLIVIIPGSV